MKLSLTFFATNITKAVPDTANNTNGTISQTPIADSFITITG